MTDIVIINPAEEILRRFGPDPHPTLIDDDPDTFWVGACQAMLKMEKKWTQHHQTFAWVDVGPSCAKAMRLPHDVTTANRLLARRRELLGNVEI